MKDIYKGVETDLTIVRYKKALNAMPEIPRGIGLDIGGTWPMKKDILKKTKLKKLIQMNVYPGHVRDPEDVIGDAGRRLPFKGKTFDFIFLGEIIEHINDLDKFLPEINRVMKMNSVGVITTPNAANVFDRMLFLFGKLPHVYHLSNYYVVDNIFARGRKNPFEGRGHVKMYTFKALQELLECYGFKIVKTSSYWNSEQHRKGSAVRWFTQFLPKTWQEGIVISFKKVRDCKPLK